ncbi:aryl-alcohol dehydrogenase-like predicted oxidoreductase [Dysgonomonas sp. PFB1-18]|uniref:aldo/keto reductase n=1 Tax=unclassified Dysgonomonas TaxID=2630389 RepID=UPI00247525CB|nr:MULTISPECIES: aldo/keto reductase [unclassified Dysgonomonas]MDH6307598.1 aryl-alcohol dehydrogenase-like predicted oxidoreductase [Dysgonomonas sp. PF1-14]MDH6337516.1 aryl-alcohol dehydrogenase-like predicted oxidoreductase [Dysgonomonas sp. PF1-16]MDH6378741.1 aryl-alcohol dehydrogenase-like predicted oxidoreductase [Dysgonomonas sp. PFB1-18]MDH6399159.1 aryl-alcohol dehydrogenase-like predicted oxidoreductase [Dysgonomonas sp. PF1-23]
MEKRRIGKSDLEVYPFSLGGNVFGWTADEKASFEILDTYVDAGFNFIDTANIYSAWVPGNKGGESETIIGNWLKKSGKRDNLIIATKVGAEISPDNKGLKKSYILKQVEDSLRRLQTDHIDLYFTHYDDMTLPVEEPLEAYAQLVKEGKVRYIGASNMSAFRIEESIDKSRENGWPEYVCIQPEYNLYDRMKYEVEYEPMAEEYGLGVVTYYSLASGFLTGKYRFNEPVGGNRSDAVKGYINSRGRHIIETLIEVADLLDATPAQVALAWLIARPSVTAPIASVSKASQLDILKAVDIKLDSEIVSRLNNAAKY